MRSVSPVGRAAEKKHREAERFRFPVYFRL